MFEIIAHGSQLTQRTQHAIPPGQTIELGRAAAFSIPWDDAISRRHAQLTAEQSGLRVVRLPLSANPIFYRGRALDDFRASVGDHFVIGQTTFFLRGDSARATLRTPEPLSEQLFPSGTLRHLRYQDAEKRIAVLSQLPEIISSARNETDLFGRMADVLLAGIDSASVVSIVQATDDLGVSVLHWDRRRVSNLPFEPSERLIWTAVNTDQSVLHIWGSLPDDTQVTFDPHHQWAFAVPIRGDASRGWAIYVTGLAPYSNRDGIDQPSRIDLKGDLKFAELVGSMLANIRQLQRLERQQATLRPFFSPVVLDAISGQEPQTVLAPRQCHLSVMFCDLRGFSKASERMATDLLGLLGQVSRALQITTQQILGAGGVVGDFHGDASMGFWGWPIDDPQSAEKACRSAVEIQRQFRQLTQQGHQLGTLNIGVGIASGTAVAGRIGTDDQVKVTAFGPVVNLAARLESMTRDFQLSILVDDATAQGLYPIAEFIEFAIREICVVRPYGLETAIKIWQVYDGRDAGLQFTRGLAGYARGLSAFTDGDWRTAQAEWRRLSDYDGAAAFLLRYMGARSAPAPNWDGAVTLEHK